MNSTSSDLLRQSLDLKKFIPKKHIDLLMMNCIRKRTFDPVSTLYCFLFQVLSNGSCKEALATFNATRVKNNLKMVSMNTAAYCRARLKLDENKLRELVLDTGKKIENKALDWRWKKRNIYLVDGTLLSMEDTPFNRSEYPTVVAKGRHQGQPKLRLLGMFDLSSGALVDAELGKYSGKGQGETTLLEKLLGRIKPNSILILDRFFTSYFLQVRMRMHKIDYVIRARDIFARKILGKKTDVVLEIKRPSKWYHHSTDSYDEIPSRIKVRVIKSSIKRDGFRTAHLYIITSLIDEKKYSKKDIEELYLQRWGVELDIRNFKCTLGATFLMSKTPSMMRKEMWVRMLAYNLIREITVISSNVFKDHPPRKRSFKTSLLLFVNFIKSMGLKGISQVIKLLKTEVLNAKYRREARAIKKRHNRYTYLTTSRKKAMKQKWGYSRREGKVAILNQRAA